MLQTILRAVRWPGWLRLACLALLLGSVPLSSVAVTFTISNTAVASFNTPAGGAVDVKVEQPSNGGTPVDTVTVPPPSPAVVTFYQYAPGIAGAAQIVFDGGSYFDAASGQFVPLPPPVALDGTLINSALVPVRDGAVFHVGEPVFITLADANRNLDSAVREVVELTVVSSTGDSELLRLLETGPDTGIFAAVIQTVDAAQGIAQFDGRLSVAVETRLDVIYQDTDYPFDRAEDDALVDPLGIVFNSRTGEPVDDAVVTMIDMATGLPATVYGDDGTSSFPATLTTGSGAVDSSGFTYAFPPGGFRFPYVAPGNYRLQIEPPTGYTAPSTVAPADLAISPGGAPYVILDPGSYGGAFAVPLGPAIKIDVPVDPDPGLLVLAKAVSQSEASAGDHLQYRLRLENADPQFVAVDVLLVDRLPPGMRYRSGSMRVDGVAVEPVISADGRTLTLSLGDLAKVGEAGSTRQFSYVVMVTGGVAPGDAINEAHAATRDEVMHSNVARAVVRIRDPLFSERFTLIGRVFEGDCTTPWEQLKGVADVRVLMEDGTYVVTDADGQYHVEGVRPGTHVVQLDADSLPPTLEPASCIDNTRFAGVPYSQFIDVRGGGLWRADFHLRARQEAVGIRVQTRRESATAPPEPEPVSAAQPQPATGEVLPAEPPAPTTFSVEFAECRAELDAAAEAVIARVTGENPAAVVARVEVVGHTDSRRLSKQCAQLFRDNHELSGARARAVADALQQAYDLPAEQVTAIGRGPDQPVASNATAAGRARNRRTEGQVYLQPPVAALPAAVAPVATLSPAGFVHRIEVDGSGPVRELRVLALLPEGYGYDPESVRVDGQPAVAPTVDGTLLTFNLGEVTALRPWQRVIDFRVLPLAAVAAPASCAGDAYRIKALANVESLAEDIARTPAVDSAIDCALPTATNPAAGEHTSERQQVQVNGLKVRAPDPEQLARRQIRANIPDTATAAGANTDWFAGRSPGVEWIFPPPGHIPRAPAVRIVVKHEPTQTVTLLRSNGEPVSSFNFDGLLLDASERMAVSIWRGVSLEDGDNLFTAVVNDAAGNPVQRLTGKVVYAGSPVRGELVPEQSVLVADGISRPVIAVRLYDRDGNPVRHGLTGMFMVAAPFVPWESLERQQERLLGGTDDFAPTWRVEGDDGIAYIELAPTTETGNVELGFDFQTSTQSGQYSVRRQEIRAWMEPAPRDWIVVGFAEGTAGYRTLKDNIQPLQAAGIEDGTWHEGQISLYAKGRVRGDWLATMAFDSDKRDDPAWREGLLTQIDPDEYYTLYGDGTEQGNDAPSQDRLYLKLERGQFYALFGDYQTGLTRTELSRYSRTLNGIKVEDGGGRLTYVLFAADTPQNFARDEIQGDGTSGLYRFTRRGIVLNSERIRLETRDRLQSQNVRSTRTLARHLDYDIDYRNGTIFFRQPVPSHDGDFNPVFIVAEYETLGVAAKELNAGGRVALALDAQEKVVVGLSALRDENSFGASTLAGADMVVKLGADTTLRVEAANSDGEPGTASRAGEAWLAEFEHHNGRYDALLYTRRQDTTFGVGQQNAAERGQQKSGIDGQVRLGQGWALQGNVYSQENLANEDTRQALISSLRYETAAGGIGLGAQVIEDQAGSGVLAGQTFRSEQATFSANRFFMDRRLELSAQAEKAFNGKADSVDFPERYQLGANYALARQVRLLAAQEFTDGNAFDTSTTRVGIQAQPWTGARLETTLNQTQTGEYGPRTFGQYGLTQAVIASTRWTLDFSADASNTFNEAAVPVLVVNPGQPVAPGGTLNTTTVGLTEDFHAFSAGANYRAPLWSWNGRAETREGETTDRYGLVSNFLRQATAGIAFASSAKWFRTEQSTGMDGVLAALDFALAWRPLGVNWSVLNRLEFKYETVANGAGAGTGLFGNNSLLVTDATTRRVINNLAINRVSREWTGTDRAGNLFNRYERNQWSLYYGAKYAMDTFDGVDYSGYTDLLGVEVRHDLTSRWDLGVQASALNSWQLDTHAWSIGPMVGWSPVKNGWITLGYNLRGFYDADFDAARYTAQGPYLQLRLKFDQHTRLWKKKESADVSP